MSSVRLQSAVFQLAGTNSHRSLPESRPDVDVRRFNELGQRSGINLTTRPDLHVAASLARSLQQASRILQQRAKEKANVDMISERSDVAERCVVDAGSRTSVVHQLTHIAATLPHTGEPAFYERPEFIALRAQPDIDRGIVFHR
jgi:hypothetical protein